MMKIPDSVLEKLHCQCTKYLSKAPVYIREGKSICNDCVGIQDPASVALPQNYQYEALASLFTFPCLYKLQGCPKQIQFNKLQNHVSECSYRIYECPINLHSPNKICNWKDTVSQLCQHYKTQHPELYVQTETPKFDINFLENHELYRLIEIDGIPLLLQTKCSLENNKIWFNMVCFKQEDSVKLINYSINLSNKNISGRNFNLGNEHPLPVTQIQMSPSLSHDENISTLKDLLKEDFIECRWDINITEALKLKIKAQQELEEEELYNSRNEDIKCVNCSFYMVPPIYRCHKGHKTCVDCKGYYNQCKSCQDVVITFTVAEDLEKISKSEQHYCRWIKCRKMLTCDEVRQHEQQCSFRIYNCPQCNIWSGALQQLVEHFRLVHPNTSFLVTPSISFNTADNKVTYTIAYNEIFKVHFESSPFFGPIKINVWFLGSPKFVNCWKYEIEQNCQKVQSQFPKQVLNNYSCTVIVDKNEDNINILNPQKKFNFSQLPTTEPNPSNKISGSLWGQANTNVTSTVTAVTQSNTSENCKSLFSTNTTENSKSVFGSNTTQSIFGSTVTPSSVTQKPKIVFTKKPVSADAKLTSTNKDNPVKNVINTLPCYTLNISKILK